jgi:RNA polymerase sigma-70 factor (ECF subfamily)
MIKKLSTASQLQQLTDKELLVKMLEGGDSQYAGELFKRYAHLVYGVCSKYIKNSAECKDMTMIVFEKLLAKPPVKDILSFRSWLFTVSKNESLTYLRNRSRAAAQKEKWENFEKNSEIFMENEGVWSLNSRAPKERDVMTALKQLKPEQQKCIELFFVHEKSYKEIAKQTGLSLGKIKSHLQNGKRRLRLLLE